MEAPFFTSASSSRNTQSIVILPRPQINSLNLALPTFRLTAGGAFRELKILGVVLVMFVMLRNIIEGIF
jgi:hypothetical protein